MNDETQKTRESTLPQQSRESTTPLVTPTKGSSSDGCKTSTGGDKNTADKSKHAQDKEPSDDSTEWPNARRTGDQPQQPIEGQRRDQGPQGSPPVGEEDKRGRADQNPGYSPFRPQAESKVEGGSATDRSATNRTSTHQSESRPAGESQRSGQRDEKDSGRKAHDPATAPMKGADANTPKPTSPSTPVEKSTGDHKRGFDDKSSRK